MSWRVTILSVTSRTRIMCMYFYIDKDTLTLSTLFHLHSPPLFLSLPAHLSFLILQVPVQTRSSQATEASTHCLYLSENLCLLFLLCFKVYFYFIQLDRESGGGGGGPADEASKNGYGNKHFYHQMDQLSHYGMRFFF